MVKDDTLPTWLAQHAETTPKQIAIITSTTSINYGDLYGQVRQLAGACLDLGISKGEVVRVQVPNRAEFLLTLPRRLQDWGCNSQAPRANTMSRALVTDPMPLANQVHSFARRPRMVFFARLPGTGKSLLTHQLAHMAVTAGRIVHLLQWDVVKRYLKPAQMASPTPFCMTSHIG
ncbi:hypothetical protein NKDENANG_01540 [Candidatus Entotheonellaceae bacterium PAL068K]